MYCIKLGEDWRRNKELVPSKVQPSEEKKEMNFS